MKKTIFIGIFVFFFIGIIASSVFAFPLNDGSKNNNNHKRSYYERFSDLTEDEINERKTLREEKRELRQKQRLEKEKVIDEICETGIIPEDFNCPMMEELEENLDNFCEFHEAKQSGMNFDELNILADELELDFLNEGKNRVNNCQRCNK